jgi:hypothetical protein
LDITGSSVVHDFNRHSDLEDVFRNDSHSCHLNSLSTSLWIAIKYPTLFTAVLLQDSALKHFNKCSVVHFVSHYLSFFAETLAENRVSLYERLYDLFRLQVDESSLLADDRGKS